MRKKRSTFRRHNNFPRRSPGALVGRRWAVTHEQVRTDKKGIRGTRTLLMTSQPAPPVANLSRRHPDHGRTPALHATNKAARRRELAT